MADTIATQLERIERAVDECKAEIVGKGVTVPSTAKIDDLPDLIAAIDQGVHPSGTATVNDVVSGKTFYVGDTQSTGQLVINKYYTGSTTPAASLGSNGDIYLQK